MAVVKADGYGHGAEATARAALEAGRRGSAWRRSTRVFSCAKAGHLGRRSLLSRSRRGRDSALWWSTHSRPPWSPASSPSPRCNWRVGPATRSDPPQSRHGHEPDRCAGRRRRRRSPRVARRAPGSTLEGVFTHFATAEVPRDWDFEAQMQRFSRRTGLHSEPTASSRVVHAANSAGDHPAPRDPLLDMVRCGIAVYGLTRSPPPARSRPHAGDERSRRVRSSQARRDGERRQLRTSPGRRRVRHRGRHATARVRRRAAPGELRRIRRS